MKKCVNVPWVDKYRPLKLDDIVYQDDTIKMLKNIVKTGNMPHLLFYGPSGVGKCLSGDTKVMLYSGQQKQAKDITVNDILMGDDGTLRNIYSTIKGEDVMYCVKQQYGDDYVVNSEHILSLKLAMPYVIETDFERMGYNITYFKNCDEKTMFSKDINVDCIDMDLKGHVCDISVKDYLEKSKLWTNCFKGFKCGILNPGLWTNDYEDAYVDGVNFNVTDATKYRTASLRTRHEFIEGVLSNGSLMIDNEKTFDDIVFILRSLGHVIDYCKKGTYYTCTLVNNNCLGTYDIKVEKLDVGQYYGFVIDGNRRFLLGDFTVTHNTSSILAIANELFGPSKIDERVIEMNASDERGINIVRNKIVTLAKMSVSGGGDDERFICPGFKIIVLDEFDSMTFDAQASLRKIMEDHSKITRFCLICNYINQIIPPIISRCAKFRFKSIEVEQMTKKLTFIAGNEKMNITGDAIEMINNVSFGDMRKGITILQNLNYLKKEIGVEDVCEIACIIPSSVLHDIINTCINMRANDITNLTNELIKKGYPLTNILNQLVMLIANDTNLTDVMKANICIYISNTEMRLTGGADEFMQLLSVFMCIKNVSNRLKSVYDL